MVLNSPIITERNLNKCPVRQKRHKINASICGFRYISGYFLITLQFKPGCLLVLIKKETLKIYCKIDVKMRPKEYHEG